MNHEPSSDHGMEREWVLQERAVRAERLGLDVRDAAKLQRYRAVARALRQPLDEDLPPDFASEVARNVRQQATDTMRLELYLSWTLLGVLAVLLLGLVVRYSSLLQAWLSNPWLMALIACVALPALLGKLPALNRLRRPG
jgi:anti-sigma factor RsiW